MNQNNPIECDLNNSNSSFYMDIVDSLFPNQILLKVPKRCAPDQKDTWIQVHDDLFVHRMPKAEVVRKYAKHLKSIQDAPIDSIAVTYKQETRNRVNEIMHKRKYPDVADCYFPGLIIRAKKRIGEGQHRINVNCDFKITEIDDKNVTFIDEWSGHSTTLVRGALIHFSLPYAYTGHSLQGSTKAQPIVIYDSHHFHVDRKWLYVALTRNKNLDLYYCDLPNPETLNRVYIQDLVNGYKQQDTRAQREWKTGFVDVDWVLQQSDKQKHKCGRCKEVMNITNEPGSPLNFTVDRNDNALPHLKFNCCLMCHKCNISKH
jgi:hypothetical protein